MLSSEFHVFFNDLSYAINAARLRHLSSLNLDLHGKKVLEVGAGVGLLTGFFESRDCTILTTDARPDNVAEIRREYPHRTAKVLDLDAAVDITDLGTFDVVFCYGTLYHLKRPEHALHLLASVCSGLILLETCVTPGSDRAINSVSEDQTNPNQAFSGIGCRPTRPWIMEALKKDFGYAYSSKHQPYHIDYDLNWQHPVEKELHRSVFVGSRTALDNSQLLTEPAAQQQYEPSSQRVWIDLSSQTNQAYIHHAEADPYVQVYHLSDREIPPSTVTNYQVIVEAGDEKTRLMTFLDQHPFIQTIDGLQVDTPHQVKDIIAGLDDRSLEVYRLELLIDTTRLDHTQFLQDLAQKGLFLVGKTVENSTQERWTVVRKDVIPFLSNIESLIQSCTPEEVLTLAQAVAVYRPLDLYPGWYFNIEWDSPNPNIKIRQAIWNYFLNQSERSIVFNWCYGLQLNLLLGNDFSSQLFIAGCYEPNELQLLSQILTPGMTFLDVGANDGLYSLLAAKLVGDRGQVVSFEPSDREFNRLKNNLDLNALRTVKPLNFALADYSGERTLNIATEEHSGQNTLGSFVYKEVIRDGTQAIAVQTLDLAIAEQNISSVDVIKVDIEGAEFAFLKGATKTLEMHHPLILMELLNDALLAQGSSSLEVLAFLKSLGYEIFSISPLTGLPIHVNRDTHLSANIVAAHLARPWAALKDANHPDRMEAELAEAEARWLKLQADFQQIQSDLKGSQHALEISQHALHNSQTELAHLRPLIDVLHNRIAAMESSKFWQIRTAWIQFKRSLGFGRDHE